MRRRGLSPRVAALAWGVLATAGCGGASDEPAPAALDPARERVLAFWRAFRAATEARIAHELEKAVDSYEEALVLDPVHEDCLYYLGQCRRGLGQPEAARAAFERLVARNPQSARGHLALGALLASPDPREPMDLDAAERYLRRAQEINGEETGPMVRLGEVLLVGGRQEEARSWFESALRTNPRSVESALLAGYLDRERGRPLAVIVERVLEAAKVDAPIQGVLGEGDRHRAPPPSGQPDKTVAAPPLESPHGSLLFEGPVRALRARAAAGQLPEREDVVRAWRDVDALLREYRERASPGAPRRAASVP